MKKIILGFVVMIGVCLCITGCGSKKTTYTELSYADFMKKIENKESFPLVVGSSQCSHCADFKITMEKFIKDYQVTVYYVDILKLSEEEYNKFVTIVNFGGSTPTTVFITDGEEKTVYNRIVGALSYSKVVSKYTSAGYIKEK